MRKIKFILILAMVLLLSAMTVQAEDGIAISQTKAIVNAGDTLELTVTGTDRSPTWTSYNANIAKVDRQGKVTALRKGKTTIRARVGYTYKMCTVTVVDSSMKLNKTAATIYHGGTSANTIQLKATVRGAFKDVTWESSNEAVAVVDDKGKVTSVKEGTAVITATANGKSASCIITVKESGISLNMDNIQVSTKGTGSAIKVTPTIIGSKKNVSWATSDKTVATVSGGKITGKKEGTAVITATANGVSATCNVTVTPGLISINEEKILLYAGATKVDTRQLKTNATKKDVVTWNSSDASVATVNEKGLVTPVSAGTAIVSVKCGDKTDTCIVDVKQTSTDIAEDSVLLKTKGTNKTCILNKQIVGKTSSVKWTTSDNKVATVSGGKVTAKKAGTATITATANGVSDTVTVNVADFDPTIKLNQPQYTLYTIKGNTVTLKATVDGASKTVLWESSDSSVATVNKGKVTAVGEGTASITASANGVTAECIIDVKESRVVLDRENISLDKGEKAVIGYDVIGTSQAVRWATANSKIATVSNGTVTAKNYGEADIKITANGVTSVCHINVTSCQHQYDNGVITVQPTCGVQGSKTFTCTLCGDSYIEAVPATDKHKYEWVTTKEADCINEGLQECVCTVCGDSGENKTVKALGHDFGEWVVMRAASNIAEGLEARTCNRCKEKETRVTPIITHEHDYVAVNTVTPTCVDNGYTGYKCASCGDYYTDDYVDALGHEAGEWVTVSEPSCNSGGTRIIRCIRCDMPIEQEAIMPLGHNYEWVTAKEATCTEDGIEENKCSSCGNVKGTRTIFAGHSWSEWEITKEPANGIHTHVSEFGKRKKACGACGEVREESIVNVDIGNDEYEQVYVEFLEDEVRGTLDGVNKLRADVGLGSLVWYEDYSDLAYIRAAELSILYSHTRPSGKERNHTYPSGITKKLGENCARGYLDAEEVMIGWTNSSGHYKNMVTEYYENYYCMGIRMYDDCDRSMCAWVQLFGYVPKTTPTTTEKYEKPKTDVVEEDTSETEETEEEISDEESDDDASDTSGEADFSEETESGQDGEEELDIREVDPEEL